MKNYFICKRIILITLLYIYGVEKCNTPKSYLMQIINFFKNIEESHLRANRLVNNNNFSIFLSFNFQPKLSGP